MGSNAGRTAPAAAWTHSHYTHGPRHLAPSHIGRTIVTIHHARPPEGTALYLLAIFVPPLAMLLCGKPVQFVINGFLWLTGIILSFFVVGLPLVLITIVHAILVVASHQADARTERLIRAMQQSGRAAALVPSPSAALSGTVPTYRISADGRKVCSACGYANALSRQSCKSCRAPLI